MAHLHRYTDAVIDRLSEHGLLAHGWDPPLASDWLAAQLDPLGWVLLVNDSGWPQSLYRSAWRRSCRTCSWIQRQAPSS